MKKFSVKHVLTIVLLSCLLGHFPHGPEAVAQSAHGQGAESEVRINGNVLSLETVGQMEAFYGVRPVPGDYWYDYQSGLYGIMGQQAAGMMYPGHAFGQMPENASNGNSGVFMNGRNITALEAEYLAILLQTPVMPGRYWLDAYGNCGIEGLTVPLVNFYEVARMRFGPGPGANPGSGSGGGDNFWSSHFSAGNYDQGNTRGYVSVPGHGPVGYGY